MYEYLYFNFCSIGHPSKSSSSRKIWLYTNTLSLLSSSSPSSGAYRCYPSTPSPDCFDSCLFLGLRPHASGLCCIYDMVDVDGWWRDESNFSCEAVMVDGVMCSLLHR
eukprot:scaffold730_cov206-Alexandrium_tamarense.AAC.6